MTETEIKRIYGKDIFEMSVSEMVENDLVEDWARLVDEYAEVDDDSEL